MTERMHELKCWPGPFEDLAAGRKPFEVRKADRDFRVGDALLVREYDPAQDVGGLAALFGSGGYTGRAVFAEVRHVMLGPVEYGGTVLVPAGVAVLGVQVLDDEPFLIVDPLERERPNCGVEECRNARHYASGRVPA